MSTASAEQKKIAGRAGIVALGTLVSRLLGLVRDLVLAARFTRSSTDAFLIAFQLPNLLRQLLAEGAVQNAVLPVLTQVREKQGVAAAQSYFAKIRGLSLLLLSVVSVLGMVFAEQLVSLFAGGFRDAPEKFAETVSLTRWVFPYIFFMGTTALGAAALNVHRRFVVSSFAPGLLNIAFVVAAFALPSLLASWGYSPIFAMAAGALWGGLLQMLAQWPSLRAIGYLSPPAWPQLSPELRETLRRMSPTLLGLGIYYIDVIIGRRILSGLGEGAVTWFGFALRLCDFPQGIFVMAVQTATLPSLAGLVAREEKQELASTFAFALRLSLFVGIPASILCLGLSEPLVAFLLERGHFDAESRVQTARALAAQGAGIFLVSGVRQLVAVYFALGDTKTPVLVAGLDLCAFVLGAFCLREGLGHVGVSWAVSLASLVQFGLLFYWLRGKLISLHLAEIGGSALRTCVCSLAGLLASLPLASRLTQVLGRTELGKAATVTALLFAFGASFLLSAYLLKSPELSVLLSGLRRRKGGPARPNKTH